MGYDSHPCDCAGRFVGDCRVKLLPAICAICETREVGETDRILAEGSEGQTSEGMSALQNPRKQARGVI
jgi:hypothetical protein